MILSASRSAFQTILRPCSHLKLGTSAFWAKLFWLAMALVHAPILIGVWRGALIEGITLDRLIPFALLMASMIFFLLKIRNVLFLRTNSDRRACIIFIMVAGLLHVDFSHSDPSRSFLFECTESVAIILVAGRWLHKKRSSHKVLGSSERMACALSGQGHFSREIWIDSFPSHSWLLVPRALGERSPPA